MRFTEDAQGRLLTVTLLTGLPIVAWVTDGQSTWLGMTADGLLAAATSFGDDAAQARLEMIGALRRHPETFLRSLELLLEADGCSQARPEASRSRRP